jgi:hypothetical protein
MKPQYAAESGRTTPFKTRFLAPAQQHRACNINLRGPTPRICGRITYSLSLRGPTSRGSGSGADYECASETEGQKALYSLSQNCLTTGAIGRLDARRAWIGPPQGASTGFVRRPLPNPIHDSRNHLQSPTTAVQALRPSRRASWRVAYVGRSASDCRVSLRHRLEDGVENAEAPSSLEGPTHRIFLYARRSSASASTGLVSDTALAPQTNASSEYDLTGA